MSFQYLPKCKGVVALALSASLLVLSACSDAPKAEVEQAQVQAVKLVETISNPNQTERAFPAEVSAVKTLEVSFEVSGRLIKENLLTGTIVKQGEILAQIDPTPFEQRLRETTARLDQAKRDLARTTSTFEKGLSSQAQLDDAKTAWELAVIARDKAQQDLSYTTLTAPFDAQVSERIVENNSYVRAGETVAKVQDVSRFYFNINVPERLLSSYQKGSPVEASASIVSAPHKQYVLQYVEHATQPDPITQTYKVVFAADGRDSSLTPGARAVVKVTLGNKTVDTGVLVPFTALQGNDTEGFHVWRYNDADSTVNRVNINVLQIEGSYALVNGEIALGERVVAAGGAKMRDGLFVKPYMAE